MKKPAFTLLEILIATSLFTVGIISVLQIFPVNRNFLAQSGQTTQASFLAQEALEEIKGLDYDEITHGTFAARSAVAPAGENLAGFERQIDVAYLDANRAVSVTDSGLKRITATVYWQQRGAERSYVLSTYAYGIAD